MGWINQVGCPTDAQPAAIEENLVDASQVKVCYQNPHPPLIGIEQGGRNRNSWEARIRRLINRLNEGAEYALGEKRVGGMVLTLMTWLGRKDHLPVHIQNKELGSIGYAGYDKREVIRDGCVGSLALGGRTAIF